MNAVSSYGASASRRWWRLGQDRALQRLAVVVRERTARREHLVEHRAERVDVGAAIDAIGIRHLLGSHELRRAGDARVLGVARETGRSPKSNTLHVVGVDQEHVVALEIAMDDAGLVGRVQRARDLLRDADSAMHRQAADPVDLLREQRALEVLEHDVGHALAREAHVRALGDVRVAERTGGARLVEEAVDDVPVGGQVWVQHLDRDAAPDHQVLCEEHGAHAARGQQLEDPVATFEHLVEHRHREVQVTFPREVAAHRGSDGRHRAPLHASAPAPAPHARNTLSYPPLVRTSLVVVVVASCAAPHPVAPPPHATVAFVDITVVPMDRAGEQPHQTVLVDGDRIVAIGPALAVPAGVARIDGRGKWLMPGLVDMHVHFNDERDGVLYVANGVTTVRNMWGNPQTLTWRDQAAKHDPRYLGPTIYTAGPITDGEPPVWPGSTVVHDAAEATAAVDAQHEAGYDFVKVYDNLSLAAYDAIAAETRRLGMRFAGHLPKAVSIDHAIASGQASIEHLTGALEEAQDATSHAATLTGPERRLELAKHRDLGKVDAIAARLAAAKLASCPTLTVLSRIGELEHPEALQARPENRYVSRATLAWWDPKHDFRFQSMTPETFQLMRDGDGFRKALVKALVDAGAPVLAGTDTPNPFVVPGFSLHEELARLVDAGLTPYQALQAATTTAATWIGDPAIGHIAVGARADLVVLDADPLVDIAATTKRTGVMVRGAWMTRAQLDGKLEQLAAVFADKGDRFAELPPLQVPAGAVELQATYATSFNGSPISAERLAVVTTKTGRTIVAQSSGDPPTAKAAGIQLELDARGAVVAYTLFEDGKLVSVKRAGGGLHVAGAKPSDLPADALIDGNLIALMIPQLARTAPNTVTKVSAKQLAADGGVTDVTYTFDRTSTPIKLTFEGGGQKGERLDHARCQGLPAAVRDGVPVRHRRLRAEVALTASSA